MKKYLFAGLFFSLGLAALQAQSIVGRIMENADTPFEFVQVRLLQASDSSFVKGTLSGEDGGFSFTGVSAGSYIVASSTLGKAMTYGEVFVNTGGELRLPDLILRDSPAQLKEVTVTARRPTIEIKADKTILNVEGTINAEGLDGLELLRKAPGVQVDNEENIVLKGKNGLRVQVDGRDVPLSGRDLADYLRSLRADDIASIEVISNPSARYDASGNAGIINIRLRKNKALGANGSVSATGIYGETPKGGTNLSLNKRSKNWNVFGSYGNFWGAWHNMQSFVRDQNSLHLDLAAKSFSDGRRHNGRFGADWYINERHTVGVLVNGMHNNNRWYSESLTLIGRASSPSVVDSVLRAISDNDSRRYNLNGNLNYRFADTSGRMFNVDLDYGVFDMAGDMFQPNFYRSPDESVTFSERIFGNNTATDIGIGILKTDYEQRLWGGAFGTGFKLTRVRTDNLFDFFNTTAEGNVRDSDRSNRFKYLENTTAAYVNYQRKWGKLDMQTGLRIEHTNYTGDLIADTPQNGETISNSYTELFPSAALNWSLTEKMGLNLTYSRRIDRPSYRDLNPFEFKLDEISYQKGNPMLRPQFTQSIEISPTWQGQPALTFGYSHTRDLFTQVVDTAGQKATFLTNDNIANMRNLSLTLNIPTKITKWWDGFLSVTGVHSQFDATFREGYTASSIFNTMNLYGEQNFKIRKDLRLQLSGWFNSPAFWGTLESDAQGAMDLGLQYRILQGKGQIRLRAGDILRTAGWSGRNRFTPGLEMRARGTWEARTVNLSFSYRFGNAEVKAARKRSTGIDEESRRAADKN